MEKEIILLGEEAYNRFINDAVGKVFKLLPLYEDYCLKENAKNCEVFYSYLEKLILMLVGSEFFQESEPFVSVASLLNGIEVKSNLSQKQMKSLVFHCISILDSARKE